MLFGFLQMLIDLLGKCIGAILLLLPSSPFSGIYTLVLDNQLLGALAWIVPFPQIIGVLESWIVAITGFYLVHMILRAAKAIE